MNKRARHKDQSGVSGVSTLQEQSVGGVSVVEQSGGIESLGTFQLQTPLTYAFMAKSQAGLIATCKDTDNDPPVAVFLRVSELTQISANVSSQLILNPAAFAASPIWRVLPSTPTSIAADIIRYIALSAGGGQQGSIINIIAPNTQAGVFFIAGQCTRLASEARVIAVLAQVALPVW